MQKTDTQKFHGTVPLRRERGDDVVTSVKLFSFDIRRVIHFPLLHGEIGRQGDRETIRVGEKSIHICFVFVKLREACSMCFFVCRIRNEFLHF